MKTPRPTNRPILARNIVQKRKSFGWSQTLLAERARIGVNTVKDIERGVSKGSDLSLESIALALGCSVEDLYQRAVSTNTGAEMNHTSVKRLAELLIKETEENEKLQADLAEIRGKQKAVLQRLDHLEREIAKLINNHSRKKT